MINYKGEICEPKNIGLPPKSPSYGNGFGATVSNGGVLVCGGDKNLWNEEQPFQGGKVSSNLNLVAGYFPTIKKSKVHFFKD